MLILTDAAEAEGAEGGDGVPGVVGGEGVGHTALDTLSYEVVVGNGGVGIEEVVPGETVKALVKIFVLVKGGGFDGALENGYIFIRAYLSGELEQIFLTLFISLDRESHF